MIQNFLQFQRSSICYYRFGRGKKLIFAFHGYSNDSRIFDTILPALENDYTFIPIDLPVHGGTHWRDGLFTASNLKKIIDLIIEKENLVKEYILLGFSLGGRIAMSFFQKFSSQVKGLVLLAPDGLYKGYWYKFIAQSFIGTQLTAYLLKQPEKARKLIDWSRKNRLINSQVYNYANGLLHSNRQRTLLAARWIIMRKMRPNLKHISKSILKYHIPVKLIFGKGDTITPEHNAEYLLQHAAPYIQFQEWEAGHLLLREKYFTRLAALFQPKF